MVSIQLLFWAFGIYGGAAILSLATGRSARWCSIFGSLGPCVAAIPGLIAALSLLTGGEAPLVRLSNEVVFHGGLFIGADPLSAFFLVPIFTISAVGAIYGRGYMAHFAQKRSLAVHWAAFNVLTASMAGVVLARDALTFLFSWEVMTLSAFVLVTFEHEIESTRRAGWVYLIASHIAFAILIAMFLYMSTRTGALSFESFAALGPSWVVFALALVGFGIKAGFYPLHVWLPEAHAAAPSHVSALMSGVLIKMGVYGVLRMFTLLRFADLWWLLIAIGLLGGLVAIGVALYQRDMKRVLAYSSIENVGIIALGAGIGMYGLHANDARVAALGFTGALFHVWNHALMKGLLFLGAGSVLHGAGSKDLDRLGGIMKRMPWTATLMILGSVAISALPPLNGFASEWLVYLGLVDRLTRGQKEVLLLLAVGLFAMLGAIACFCFVRLVGIALVGVPRSGRAETAHESPRSMIGAMIALLVLCMASALAPNLAVRLLSPAVAELAGASPALDPILLGLQSVGLVNVGLWIGIAAVTSGLMLLIARNGAPSDSTWGCGYPASTSRIQYVARSFSEAFAEHVLPKPFRARITSTGDRALFAPTLSVSSDDADPMTRGAYEPFLARWAERLSRLRWMQQGVLHIYLVYILAIALIGVAWLSVRELWQP